MYIYVREEWGECQNYFRNNVYTIRMEFARNSFPKRTGRDIYTNSLIKVYPNNIEEKRNFKYCRKSRVLCNSGRNNIITRLL